MIKIRVGSQRFHDRRLMRFHAEASNAFPFGQNTS
jgi:hypothetical protein